MKQILSFFLCLALLTGFVGCGQTSQSATQAQQATMPTIAVFDPKAPVAPETEPESPEDILAHRRDVVEQHMRYMSTVRWSVDSDVTYSYKGIVAGVADAESTITLRAGRVYQGIPYTHGSGSAYGFLDYAVSQDENGVYQLSGLNQEALDGVSRSKMGHQSRVGNDCADMVYWAWAQISSSISFENTNHMTPAYGCLPVGDYEWNEALMRTSTVPTCQENGMQRMFAAYAQLQKGDAIVRIVDSGGGHAIMIVTTHVEYNGDEIDGEKSYVTILEQGSGPEVEEQTVVDEKTGETIYLCEKTDQERTFATLYQLGYLPITCKELIDPSPLPETEVTDSVEQPSLENLYNGTVTSNYRISSVTITVWNADGQPVQQLVCHAMETEKFTFMLNRIKDKWEQSVLVGNLDINALTPGTYRCTYDCRVSTGEVITFRDFTFTK